MGTGLTLIEIEKLGVGVNTDQHSNQPSESLHLSRRAHGQDDGGSHSIDSAFPQSIRVRKLGLGLGLGLGVIRMRLGWDFLLDLKTNGGIRVRLGRDFKINVGIRVRLGWD
jgi:hypothetical protein